MVYEVCGVGVVYMVYMFYEIFTWCVMVYIVCMVYEVYMVYMEYEVYNVSLCMRCT